eukprot:TRINITY_DN3669_c0_g1_i1.p1 TRINITY_DN3669_c0_g1~~TRINITY_DN3669_c0_g1_i1.p1  ORF type:complete len:272 (+),score=81.56 TRINITY_DN3669_c0_g1_i1:267-1082(+)
MTCAYSPYAESVVFTVPASPNNVLLIFVWSANGTATTPCGLNLATPTTTSTGTTSTGTSSTGTTSTGTTRVQTTSPGTTSTGTTSTGTSSTGTTSTGTTSTGTTSTGTTSSGTTSTGTSSTGTTSTGTTSTGTTSTGTSSSGTTSTGTTSTGTSSTETTGTTSTGTTSTGSTSIGTISTGGKTGDVWTGGGSYPCEQSNNYAIIFQGSKMFEIFADNHTCSCAAFSGNGAQLDLAENPTVASLLRDVARLKALVLALNSTVQACRWNVTAP